MWPAVCPPPTEKVACTQVDQHQADDVRPDDIARTEDIPHKARGGKFDRQGCHSREEDSDEKKMLAIH